MSFHITCQQDFEQGYLLPIFQHVLQSVSVRQHEQNSTVDVKQYFEEVSFGLEILEIILCWRFSANYRHLQPSLTEDDTITACFPSSWSSTFLDPNFLPLFFEIHQIIQHNEQLNKVAYSCLVQLASVQGPVFHNDNARKEYICNFLISYQALVTRTFKYVISNNWDSIICGEELSGVGQVAKSFLSNFRLQLLLSIKPESLQVLESIGALTVGTIQTLPPGDNVEASHADAQDLFLEFWTIFIEEESARGIDQGIGNMLAELGLSSILIDIASSAFRIYVQKRMEINPEEVDEYEPMSDMVLYSDRLTNIAVLGRIDPDQSLEMLKRILGVKVTELKAIFTEQVKSDYNLHQLYENIHWLTLITGHIIADYAEGEKNMIPRSILHWTGKSEGASFFEVVDLVFQCLDILTVEADSNLLSDISPALAESLLWFVQRWCSTYLLLVPSDYYSLSKTMIEAFSTEGRGIVILDFIIQIVRKNFIIWNANEEVLKQCLRIIDEFSKNGETRNRVLENDGFKDTISFLFDSIEHFPPSVQCDLVQSSATIATYASSDAIRQEYFVNFDRVLSKSLLSQTGRPDFHSIHQNGEIVASLMSTLDMFCGFAASGQPQNQILIFQTVSKHFGTFIAMTELYHSSLTVVSQIFRLFRTFLENQSFSQLLLEDRQVICNAVAQMLQTFANNNISGQSLILYEKREFNEVLFEVISVLHNLLVAQFKDYENNSEHVSATNVSEILFVGTKMIAPLIEQDFLDEPRNCLVFSRLITAQIKHFPEKLPSLPLEVLDNLVKGLEYGSKRPITEIARLAYSGMSRMAQFAVEHRQESSALAHYLDHLVNIIIQNLFFEDLRDDIMEAAAEALFSLLQVRKEQFYMAFNQIVAQQPMEMHPIISKEFSQFATASELALAQASGYLEGAGHSLSEEIGSPITSSLEFRNALVTFEADLTRLLSIMRSLLRVK
ncbi:hypothetical protein BJ742DRAFT_189682 [Cladochytrium replicatum]|nr:hypothetical protein BJ742DRAFT_189682 [Cladochytrium replicatum]